MASSLPPGLRSEVCSVTYSGVDTAQSTFLCAVSSANSLVHSPDLEMAFSPKEMAVIRARETQSAANDCIVGRYAAKLALSAHFREHELLNFRVLQGALGQPTLHYRHGCVPEISIAHNDGIGIAVLAPSGSPIGIDFEPCARLDNEVVAHQFGSEERRIMARFEPDESARHIRLWTMKEALSKALRCGLTVPMEFLSLANVYKINEGGYMCGELKHFPVFRAHSWRVGSSVVSLVIPRNLSISVDMRRIASIVASAPNIDT